MRVLILGGTRFPGRAIVDAALGRGDTITLFDRGQTNPGFYPGVETVIGDRAKDLSALDGREPDAVIDVACYDPAVARLSAEALAKRAGRPRAVHRRARPGRMVRRRLPRGARRRVPPDGNPAPVRGVSWSARDRRVQRCRAELDPFGPAGRRGGRSGDGHPAVGRRAGL